MIFNISVSSFITNKVSEITTDDKSNIIFAISKLNEHINPRNGTNRHVGDFHVHCLTHIVNFAVKHAFKLIKIRIYLARFLFFAVRCTVKHRDLFGLMMKYLSLNVSILSLGVQNRWSSTFNMITSAYKAKRVFTLMNLLLSI